MHTKNIYKVFLNNETESTILADDYKTEDGLIKFYNDSPKYDYSGTSVVGWKRYFNGVSFNINVVKITRED
jgi:hypothetical protein